MNFKKLSNQILDIFEIHPTYEAAGCVFEPKSDTCTFNFLIFCTVNIFILSLKSKYF
jgi:hypothetical protein